ncbi:MAG: hypothetical protein ABEN55_22400, partial [Bradymonadaceae bacterium]
MTFATTTRVSPTGRGLAKWIAIAVVAAVACLGAPRSAGAQQSRVKKMVEEASNHYDMLEIGTA